ncbi:type VI secretion system amidase immunity protein Tai4 [Enterobacter sp.]|uniref:type VI secretion system amidase immunity protein Tai4 n=1 Tax=Enterobacter sp. TaxID=42895 RepID=UPI003990C430
MIRLKLCTLCICGMLVWQPSYAQEALTREYSQPELLRNWALSHCLALVYKNDAVKNDASATASAYLEYGKQSLETYHEIDEIAKKYAELKYTGSIASEFNTMKCIDFIHGRELNELIHRRVGK